MKKAIALTFAILMLTGCGQPAPSVKLSSVSTAAKSTQAYEMSSLTVPDSVIAYANDYVKRMSAKYQSRQLEFYADVVASQDNFKTKFVSSGNCGAYNPDKGCFFFSSKFSHFGESTHTTNQSVTPGSYKYFVRVSVREPYAAHQASFLNEPVFYISDFGKNFDGAIKVETLYSK